MNEQVPLQEQQQGDNEFFEYIQNEQNITNTDQISPHQEYATSPARNSAYSLRAASANKDFQKPEEDEEQKRYQDNELSIQQASETQFADDQYEKGIQLLSQLQAKQNDNRVADFLNQTESIGRLHSQQKQQPITLSSSPFQQSPINLNVQQSFGILQQTKPADQNFINEQESSANSSYLLYQKMMEGTRANRHEQQKQSLNLQQPARPQYTPQNQNHNQNRESSADPLAQQYEYQMQQQQIWQQQMMKQIAMQKMQQQQQSQQQQIQSQVNQSQAQQQVPPNPLQYQQMMQQLEQYGNVTQSQHFDVFHQQLKKLDPQQILNQHNGLEGQVEEQAKGTELFAMYVQIIGFYDKNLNNLKNIILQKDQDITVHQIISMIEKSKDNKIKELTQLVNQMKSSFNVISSKYESENSELMKRYLQTIELYGVRKLDEEQKLNGEKEQIMMEYVQLKQQHVELNNQKINLEIMVKDLDIKHQSDLIRMNDLKMKIEYMQNEIHETNQSKQLLDSSNYQLLQQLEQLKISMMEQQRQNQQWQMQVKQLSMQVSSQQQMISDQKKQNQFQQQQQQQQYFLEQTESAKIMAYPTQLNNQYQQQQQPIYPPLLLQQPIQQTPIPSLQAQYQQNLQSEINKSQHSQNKQTQPSHQNQPGIMAFPSDQKYYNQLDEMNALSKELQDLNFRKQQIESELNKRIAGSKTALERKKREQQEREVDELSEQISKIKLKLREFKQ